MATRAVQTTAQVSHTFSGVVQRVVVGDHRIYMCNHGRTKEPSEARQAKLSRGKIRSRRAGNSAQADLRLRFEASMQGQRRLAALKERVT